MSRLARLVLLTLFMPALVQAGVLDTHERETQKRREDGYRADAPNNPGSTPQVPQGFIDEMRRRTESQGGQDISPATRAFMAEQEEMKRRLAEEAKELERRTAIRKAEERASLQLDYDTRMARVNAIYAEDAASATPNQPAVFDRAMAVAYPEINAMLAVARRAQQVHPELWRLRLGFLLSAGCDHEALTTRIDWYDESEFNRSDTAKEYCDKARYYRGLVTLRPGLKASSVLDRALSCGLIYNWMGRWTRPDPFHWDARVYIADEAKIAQEIKACQASLPAGHAFTEGLFEPLFLLGEQHKRDVSQVLWWWPLFSPATWEGVNLADAAAIRAVVDRVAAEDQALQPEKHGGSSSPAPAPADPLAGMTPEQVRKELGRPDKKLQRMRVDMYFARERAACLAWQDRGPLEAWAYGQKVKVNSYLKEYAVQWVVFNREGKACVSYNERLGIPKWKAL